jgi:hypothetical protein
VGHFAKDRRLTHSEAGVYVGRPNPRLRLTGSRLANPYRLDRHDAFGHREAVLRAYATRLRERTDLLALVPDLRGRLLLCWCHTVDHREPGVDAPCHGDLLAWLANGLPDDLTALTGRAVAVEHLRVQLAGWPDRYPGQRAWLSGALSPARAGAAGG